MDSLYLLADVAEDARLTLEKHRNHLYQLLHQLMQKAYIANAYSQHSQWQRYLEACQELDNGLENLLQLIDASPTVFRPSLQQSIRRWKERNSNNIYIARVELYC